MSHYLPISQYASPLTDSKTANIADGAVRLTTSQNLCKAVIISPKSTNSGTPKVGLSSTAQPNSVPFMYPAIEGKLYRLDEIYMKVDANGDGVEFEGIY